MHPELPDDENKESGQSQNEYGRHPILCEKDLIYETDPQQSRLDTLGNHLKQHVS